MIFLTQDSWTPREGEEMVSSGDSSTTQPYDEEDECEQRVDRTGYSTPAKANAANANCVRRDGTSPTSNTPSLFPQRRPNSHTNAAAASSRDRYAPSTSRTHGESIASLAVWNNDPVQTHDCFDDLLNAREGDAARTHASRIGFAGGNASHCELAVSPSLSTRDAAIETTTPVRTHCGGEASGSTTPGTETNDKRSETQQTRKRTVSRSLFQDSNPAKTLRISTRGVEQTVPEHNCPAVQSVRTTEGTTNTIPCRAHVPSGEISGLPERNVSQRRPVFGEQQPIRWPHMSENLRALCCLDFTTAFRVLERFKGTLESFTVDDLNKLKTVPKAEVETYLLHLDGLRTGRNHDTRETKSCPANPRFECCVNCTGELTFKISEQKESLTALQRCFGPDRVLRVFFADRAEDRKVYVEIMKEGIFVGLRHYEYWTHKDTKKDFEKQRKPVDGEFWSSVHCYFVCTSSWAESDKDDPRFRQFSTIFEARCYMMHIHTTASIPKYNSRLQLALSNTQPVDLDFSTINVRVVNDIHCKDEERDLETVCTDGTGYISVDLAKEIAVCLKNGMKDPEKFTQDYPSLIQIRLFYKGSANKGTLLAHNRLGSRTIVLRKSMQKVLPDPELSNSESFNSLEICGWSKPPREAKLSRDLILLLTLGGVPGSFFTDLVDEEIQKVRSVLNDAGPAYHAIRDQDSELAKLAQKMLLAGISPKEPYLQTAVMTLREDLIQDYRKGKVFLPDSCYLYGTADPTGTLKRNQVAITLGHGLVYWPQVAVYKSPGKHPGDIHVFEAIANKELQDIVGTGKFVIFFSTQGSRSIPDEIANSDLDGDKYLIIWNTKLLADYVEEPKRWLPKQSMKPEHVMPMPADLPSQQLQDKLIENYMNIRFSPSTDVGRVSNWWTEHFDRSLFLKEANRDESEKHRQQAKELVDIFYELVDSVKTGIKVHVPPNLRPRMIPHFQEKGARSQETSRRSPIVKDKNFGYGTYVHLDSETEYHSTTILGQIYDKAIDAEKIWRLQSRDEIEIEQAFSYTGINGITAQEFHDLRTKWEKHFKTYKVVMRSHMNTAEPDTKSAGCESIYLRYRRLLYDADSFDKTRTDLDKIFANASAIYLVVYDAAIRQRDEGNGDSSLVFAWKVAGAALCTMYEKHHRPHGEEQLIVSLRTFESFFGKLRSRNITEDDSPPGSPYS